MLSDSDDKTLHATTYKAIGLLHGGVCTVTRLSTWWCVYSDTLHISSDYPVLDDEVGVSTQARHVVLPLLHGYHVAICAHCSPPSASHDWHSAVL